MFPLYAASVKSVLGLMPTLLSVMLLVAIATLLLCFRFAPRCPACRKRMDYRPECDVGHKFCTLWECHCGHQEVIPVEPPPPPGPPPRPFFDPEESVSGFLKRWEVVAFSVINGVMIGLISGFAIAYPNLQSMVM